MKWGVLRWSGSACMALVLAMAASAPAAVREDSAIAPTALPPAPASPCTPPRSPVLACPIAALTPVVIVIDAELGSKISKPGDTFPLHLRSPIIVNGVELVPAGTAGMGEVVHSKRAGMSGSPGELILAARYLAIGGQRLPLRSLHLVAGGTDHTRSVTTLAIVSAPMPIPVALVGLFMTGGNTVVPAGTVASARTAADFLVPLAAGAAPPATITSSSTGGEQK